MWWSNEVGKKPNINVGLLDCWLCWWDDDDDNNLMYEIIELISRKEKKDKIARDFKDIKF